MQRHVDDLGHDDASSDRPDGTSAENSTLTRPLDVSHKKPGLRPQALLADLRCGGGVRCCTLPSIHAFTIS